MVDRLAPARGIVLSAAAGALLWLALGGLAAAGWRVAGGAMTEPTTPYALASALLGLALGLAWRAVQ